METAQEIADKVSEMFGKMLDDEENYEQHFEKLSNYIDGLDDVLKAQGGKGIAGISIIIMIFKALLDLRTRIKENAKKSEEKHKELTERLERIENEFKEMKAGK